MVCFIILFLSHVHQLSCSIGVIEREQPQSRPFFRLYYMETQCNSAPLNALSTPLTPASLKFRILVCSKHFLLSNLHILGNIYLFPYALDYFVYSLEYDSLIHHI